MVNVLIALALGCFVAVLFLNIYFRMRVLQKYRILIANEVEFDRTHMFDAEKLEREVLSKYPQQREDILVFINNIKFSMKCATALVTIVTVVAAVLMFSQE